MSYRNVCLCVCVCLVCCVVMCVCVCDQVSQSLPSACCSLERLSQMFELPVKEVHSIVSRMIIKEELLVRLNTHVRMSQ